MKPNDSLHVSQLRVVLHLCGFLVLLYSLSMLPPMVIALLNKERTYFAFLTTFLTFFSLGGLTWRATRHAGIQLRTRDGFVIIVLFWLLFSLISAMPLWMDDGLQLSFADALFEGVSGITTTGATVIGDVSALPKSYLYYRAQLNFIGGLGVIVLAVAVLPLSEMPGPFKEERLTPRLADTARTLWVTYFALGVACTLAYWLAGMSFFDAVCHGLSTVSLGGFSTRSESIGFYDSHAIELVAGAFSLLSAFNFTLWYVAIVRRTLKPIRRSPEVKFFLSAAAAIILITAWQVWHAGMYSPTDSLVHAFFLASSMMTDNGLSTADYAQGGCVGSTCGGIKALRFLIMFKQSIQEMNQLAHPRALLSIKVGKSVVNERVLRSVWSFFFLYVMITGFFVWALNLMGYDLFTSFATVAACINNMGLGFGETASTFGTLTEGAKLLMCAAMILGRLEIYPVLILFSRFFWRA
ncbi:MAG: potassium transporter TrkG [Enterobacter sp.]|nr:potassium transporter TrkG [Enterobacter sp.]